MQSSILSLAVIALVSGFAGHVVSTVVQSAPAEVVVNEQGETILAPEIDQSACIWWSHLGENSLALLNLGPILESDSGFNIRRWVMVIHMGEGPEPLSCLQGILNADESKPLAAWGGEFSVQLRPAGELTWGEVDHSSMVKSFVDGMP